MSRSHQPYPDPGPGLGLPSSVELRGRPGARLSGAGPEARSTAPRVRAGVSAGTSRPVPPVMKGAVHSPLEACRYLRKLSPSSCTLITLSKETEGWSGTAVRLRPGS